MEAKPAAGKRNQRKNEVSCSLELPDVQVCPTYIVYYVLDYILYKQVAEVIDDPFNEEYSVEVKMSQVGFLQASFFIKIEPAAPKKWRILYAGHLHEGIMLGEPEDFSSKLRGWNV